MNDWKAKNLSDLCSIKGGKRLPAGQGFSDYPTPFPYIRVTNMVKGSVDDTCLEYVPTDIEPKIRNYKISKDDLYVTIAGTLGKFGTIPSHLDNAQLTENAAKLCDIDTDVIDKNYLCYLLNSQYIQHQIYREIGVGGGVPKLALHRIETLKVIYPKLLLQQKIVKILATCDGVISQTEKAIEKYKNVKKGMMNNLFTRGIDINTGKLRPSYQEKPELYRQSELGWIPKSWNVRKLKESTYLKGRIGWQGLKASEFIESGPYLITGTDFKRGRVEWSNCYHVSESRFNEAKYIQIQNSDVLITKDGTIGKVAYVEDCPEQAVLNSGVFLLRCKDETYINKYMFHLLNASIFKVYLYKTLGGSTIKHLYQREFEKFPVPLPQHSEQKEIIKRMDSIDESIRIETIELKKYQQIKEGLMQDLLTGKVQVQTDYVA